MCVMTSASVAIHWDYVSEGDTHLGRIQVWSIQPWAANRYGHNKNGRVAVVPPGRVAKGWLDRDEKHDPDETNQAADRSLCYAGDRGLHDRACAKRARCRSNMRPIQEPTG